MKYRESDMPPIEMWEAFFNSADVLAKMGVTRGVELLVDIGCGYGTFILPAALTVKQIIGIDIDPDVLDHCQKMIAERNITNIELILDDFSASDYDVHKGSADYVSLFNILHCDEPVSLLRKAKLIVKQDGRIGVIHWKHEKTPRGPSVDIRPKPEQVTAWAESIDLMLDVQVDLPPHHYGLIFKHAR